MFEGNSFNIVTILTHIQASTVRPKTNNTLAIFSITRDNINNFEMAINVPSK